VWSFHNDFHIAYEAKTEKKESGLLSKKDLQEAKGHPEWVRAHLCDDQVKAIVEVVVVAPSPSLHQICASFCWRAVLRRTRKSIDLGSPNSGKSPQNEGQV